MHTGKHHPVLVVGGGIVGLSASLALSHHGVPSLLVEAHPGTHDHPRARSLNARAMEIYRELGVADAVREAGAPLARAEGLHRGPDLATALAAVPRRPESGDRPASIFAPAAMARWSPTTGRRATLDAVEPVLLAAARRRPAEIRFGTLRTGLRHHDDHLAVDLTDVATGATETVTADYLIAADGAGGALRHELGVASTYGTSHGHQLNILFRADLEQLVRGREFSVVLIARPGVRGMLTAIDARTRWAFHLRYDPAVESPADYPPERCEQILRDVLGVPGVEPRVVSVLPWEARERTLDRLRAGRVFFAGDAAHQMPPAGARGASTGIADVHNLVWKLAAVLGGRADETLLDTYHDERHPAAVHAVAASGANARAMTPGSPSADPDWTTPAAHGLGDRYRSAAVLTGEEDPAGPVATGLDGSPGTRLPHAWTDPARTRSTLDLPAGDWILLGPPAWHLPADAAGLRHTDPGPEFAALAGTAPDGAVLVRPDGHIAWRSTDLTTDPTAADLTGADPTAATLDAALGRLPFRARHRAHHRRTPGPTPPNPNDPPAHRG
ncbi:FAD-dependent monooxygenase [Kitasatospora sp. NPDC086791]|uniref:FAD-dependent monooxygenase n=1 Tax=Kitasatospora sp. NPDC086791 TaxID=3155178 RepID=UPI00342B96CF